MRRYKPEVGFVGRMAKGKRPVRCVRWEWAWRGSQVYEMQMLHSLESWEAMVLRSNSWTLRR